MWKNGDTRLTIPLRRLQGASASTTLFDISEILLSVAFGDGYPVFPTEWDPWKHLSQLADLARPHHYRPYISLSCVSRVIVL